jgi:hypothetical protein
MISDCSAARRPTRRRMRITDGLLALDRGEQAAEVGVSGDQDSFVCAGAFENSFVGCCLRRATMIKYATALAVVGRVRPTS